MHTGSRPFLRLVGRNQIAKAGPWLETAAEQAAVWIRDGLKPYPFVHAPEDTLAPSLCQRFHHRLKTHLPDLPELDWSSPHREQSKQVELF